MGILSPVLRTPLFGHGTGVGYSRQCGHVGGLSWVERCGSLAHWRIASTRVSIIVDVNTSRPDVENFGLNATYSLTEIGSGKVVVTGQTFARVSYDIPGQEQRFARVRGLRDAETRAAKVIADNIRSRPASYFIAGT